jgi:hypothetical protein
MRDSDVEYPAYRNPPAQMLVFPATTILKTNANELRNIYV